MNPIPIPPGMETRLFVLETDALKALPEAIRTLWGPNVRIWPVADGNTWRAAGSRVREILEQAGFECLPQYLFPAHPVIHASDVHVDELLAVFPENAVPVAVGSGTINDLVKRASGVKNVSYCCVPTAPSVDGYTSSGAALNMAGLKKTMPCPAPLAVVADIGVLQTAPAEMFAAGYADLMAKIPAGADWLVVDALGLEPIDPAVWELVQTPLRDNLSAPDDVRRVFLGLAATGYGMQLYRDSRPASGADHLISHIWEMENLEKDGEPVSHGFKVGLGTLAATALYETLFSMDPAEAQRLAAPGLSLPEREAEIDALLIRGCYGTEAKETALKKFLEGEALADRRAAIYAKWDELRELTRRQLFTFEELTSKLRAAHCPVKPAEINLTPEQFFHGLRAAQLIRKRYTVLDLTYELGLLDEILGRIEEKHLFF